MPNGEANITNSVLEMMHADRHTVGHYKCVADNRVGQPDVRDILVNVLCKYKIFRINEIYVFQIRFYIIQSHEKRNLRYA